MKLQLQLAIALLFPLATLAHGYWIELDGPHKVNERVVIRLYFGEYITGERLSGSYLDRMKEIKIYVQLQGRKEPVSMIQQKDYWEGSYIPQAEGNYEFTGINDEREVQDWTRHNLGIVRPIQYLKAMYQVGSKQSPLAATNFLDIIVSNTGAQYAITLYKNGQAYAGATLIVTHPDGEETTLHADPAGKTVFEAPKKGLYILDAEWIDTTPGHFKGKDYKTTRHKLDYTLYY